MHLYTKGRLILISNSKQIFLKKLSSLSFYILTVMACSLAAESMSTEEKRYLFSFDDQGAWEEKRFSGKTDYQFIQEQGKSILRAESRSSASGLMFKKELDISKTPYLNWRWKLEKALPELGEYKKQGDDYAARIYIIHSSGWFFWQTFALNYVWSSRAVKDTSWPNAYAPDNALMSAVRDKTDKNNVWYNEKRHVLKDFKRWLAEDVSEIEGIAIMTDTDDSKGHAIVYYADIFFSAD